MKKISILTLSLFITLNNVCVVNAAPRRNKNARRQSAVSVKQTIQSATQSNSEVTVVNNAVTTATDSAVSSEAQNTVVNNVVSSEAQVQKTVVNNTNTLNNLVIKTQAVQNACSGIKSNLDTIFGLSVATTVSSGLGTLASGGALAVGIVKAKTDKKLEELEKLSSLELYEQAVSLENKMKEQSALEKKSKTLGNIRTGLMAGATVTSAVSTGTSIGTTLNASKLADKMSDCNDALRDLKVAKSMAEAEGVEATNPSVIKAGQILSVCTGYDESNIKSLKNLATANTIVSGIGTLTAGAGTVTSFMANSDKTRNNNTKEGKAKEKNLNTASNILAGVTLGTSATSTTLSAVQISKAKKDSDMAEKCEKAL